MSRTHFWILCIACICWAQALAQDRPDDLYLRLFAGIQEADRQAAAGQSDEARTAYQRLLDTLRQFQHDHPDWNPEVVAFRLRYLEQRVRGTESVPRATNAPPAHVGGNTNDTGSHVVLLSRLRQLELENERLVARLREALAAQPAVSDPAELARAEARVRDLEKEVDSLRLQVRPGENPDSGAGASAQGRNAPPAAGDAAGREPLRSLLRGDLPGAAAWLASLTNPPPIQSLVAVACGRALLDQNRAEEALRLLGRAAEQHPGDVEVLHWLGRSFAACGMVGPAEEILKKAVALQPALGGAHLALASLYARQQPPSLSLARWHYAQAIQAGVPRDAALEAQLGPERDPPASQVTPPASTPTSPPR